MGGTGHSFPSGRVVVASKDAAAFRPDALDAGEDVDVVHFAGLNALNAALADPDDLFDLLTHADAPQAAQPVAKLELHCFFDLFISSRTLI